jgi:hypothetical protein
MRYKPGSVALSETYDVPLLLHVRNARCISQEQLQVLLDYGVTSLARRRIAWRVDRLVRGGFLHTLDQRVRGDKVCTITSKGLEYLETCGHGLVSIHSTMGASLDPNSVMHWLELVDVRLIFLRSGVIAEWKSEVEVSSENIETGGEYAKDYDAVVKLCGPKQPLRVGIEYERTTKASHRYSELREHFASEQKLDAILYFVRETTRLFSVAGQLEKAHPAILFGSFESFCLRGLNALFLRSVVEPGASLAEIFGFEASSAV